MTRRIMGVIAGLALVFGAAGAALAEEKATGGAGKTVTGELVDSACYFGADKKGPGHRKCAEMCIKGGAPMGVLTGDGTVYILLADHNNEKPYEELKNMAAESVEVSGKDVSKGGVNAIVVASAKKAGK